MHTLNHNREDLLAMKRFDSLSLDLSKSALHRCVQFTTVYKQRLIMNFNYAVLCQFFI